MCTLAKALCSSSLPENDLNAHLCTILRSIANQKAVTVGVEKAQLAHDVLNADRAHTGRLLLLLALRLGGEQLFDQHLIHANAVVPDDNHQRVALP